VAVGAVHQEGGRAARAAGGSQVVLGTGFGIGALVTLRHMRDHDELPLTPFGFRAFAGPFERVGRRAFTMLLGAFAALCAVDIVTGVLLWQRRRIGYAVGMVTSVPSLALAAGFALPVMLIGIPLRVALTLAGRRSLR
jgi:hypothetical protein